MARYDEDPEDTHEDRHGRGLPTKERDYLIPAKDTKGQSARVQCRVQPEVVRLIADVHQSRKYPFRVQGDLIRWCVHTGVNLLAGGAGIPSVMAQAEVIRQMLIDEEYQLQYQDNFRTLKRVIDRYIELGAPQKARELLIRTHRSIEEMPGDYWKTQYLQELDKRYGALIEGEHGHAERRVIHAQSAFGIDEDE